MAACKKENLPVEPPLLQDGPLSGQLGKLIYMGNNEYSRSAPFWGKNSDELFITASTKILRIDLAAKKVDIIENFGGIVTGKTNENSGVIFLGKISNQYGYYVFNFSSNTPERIITPPNNLSLLINIAGNNIFCYLYPVSEPTPPCRDYCWPIPRPFVPATFYHLDKQTQEKTELKNKRFLLFSMDGSRAILTGQQERRMYVFDNTSRTIIDSANINSTSSSFGLFYYKEVLQSFEADVLGNITIKNFKTGQIFRQYQTNKVALDGFRVSADGTKLYYSGGFLNGSSKIFLYDIATNTEKIIADVAAFFFVLSDDNKKLVTQLGNELYVKVLD